MPRRGDEANRLGNEYERLWIADSLLDVLAGDATSVTVAGFGAEGQGIDLIKQTKDGFREFHSLKRQTTNPTWKLRELSERRVFDELLGKLGLGANHKAVFVSGTTPNALNELCERASRSKSLSAFQAQLNASPALRTEFESHFLPHCSQDWNVAWNNLLRLRVGGMPSVELDGRISQKVRFLVQRKDGKSWSPLEVRLLLTHLVLEWLGQAIEKRIILEYLSTHGFVERIYLGESSLLDRVQALAANYISDVEGELIHGHQIERNESKAAFDALTNGQNEIVAVIGAAGLGKSCVLAQTLRLLSNAPVPLVVARLDVQTRARTSQQFGEDLNLPESPCLILAGIAQGSPCVLVLDQLDALSTVSGRNAHLWTAFGELLREAAAYPNMRVMVACRAFDAEHDRRLRRLLEDKERSHRIQLSPLSIEQVKDAITKAGVKLETLGSGQMEILRTPQHLNLYLQSKPQGRGPFRDVKELFDRYWETKQQQVSEQAGRETRFTEVVRKLAGWLSNQQTLAAPSDVLDEFHGDARVMASAHVLILSDGSWRFFHESFFDYAFARTFVAEGGKLLDLLLSSGQEQHLFRRAQVRQILTYQRDRDLSAYLKDLEALLAEPRVRFHIKKLTLDWLRRVDKPTVAEWRLLSRFSDDPHLSSRIKTIPHNSPGWFDILKQEGVWNKWLASKDEAEVRHAIWLLGLSELNKHRSAEIADLINPLLDGSVTWRNHFAHVVQMGQPHRSRMMFDLFMQAVREGCFDHAHGHWWYFTVHIAEEAPEMAAEFLDAFVERWSIQFGGEKPIDSEARQPELPEQFIHTLEQRNPLALARRLFLRITAIVQKYAETARDGGVTDKVWGWKSFGSEHSVSAALLGALQRSIQKLATEAPHDFDGLSLPVEKLPHETIAFLLLSAWTVNPQRYADKVVTYMCSDPQRLDIGYTSWGGGGYGPGHVSRVAVRAVAPCCTEENYRNLEQAILQFEEFGERSRKGGRGYKRFLLLTALPQSRRSSKAQSEFEQLARKFPGERDGPLQSSGGVFSIESPIGIDARKKMTDEQWVRAMEKYSKKRSRETYEEWRKGGCDELAGALKTDTAQHKSRFAALALKMPADLPPVFFARLLDGLVETEPPKDGQSENPEATRLLDTETMVLVLRQIHGLPGQPCGRDISWAVRKLADRQLPDEVLEMVAYYATNDPDPTEELWKTPAAGGTPYYGGDPESAGLNCNRGAAADTLAKLLFAKKDRWTKLKAAIQSVSRDHSLAVRAMAIECLTAALNVDRNWPVEEFLKLADGAEEILGGHNADWFLHYSTMTHYDALRPLLLRMLKAPEEKVRKVAARRITVAALHEKVRPEDLATVLQSDPVCRAAAAEVFSNSLGYEPVRANCREHLKKLFNDPEKSVRDKTDHCFRKVSDQQLSEEVDLIASFINSEAFADDAAQLCFALKESTSLLPDVVCGVAERLIQLHRQRHGEQAFDRFHSSGHYISELIVRLYQQTMDTRTKSRCLNIIDEMLRVEIWNADEELEKVER
jgi:hypothetical protein